MFVHAKCHSVIGVHCNFGVSKTLNKTEIDRHL
jgi:hypothetical protein